MAIKKRIRRKIRRKAPSVRRSPSSGPAQAAKVGGSDLMVGGVMDPAEKAADQMADRALSAQAPVTGTAPTGGGALHRKCADCAAEDDGKEVKRAATPAPVTAPGASSAPASKPAAQAVNSIGSGRRMNRSERAFYEPRFNRDFSDVRIHDGPTAARATRALDARAFAHGRDIAFAPGEKTPKTMAHELAHVVQDDGVTRRVCASGATVGKGKFKIKPIVVADDNGKNPTSFPSTQKLKDIFGKCCLKVGVGSTAKIKKSSFKTLDFDGSTLSAEGTKLIKKKRRGSSIEVYIVENFKNGGTIGKNIGGGGFTVFSGQKKASVVLVNGTDPTVLAHEVAHAHGAGHALGTSSSGNPTVAKPSGSHSVAVSENVSKEVCDKARGSAHTKGAKAKGKCCQDLS